MTNEIEIRPIDALKRTLGMASVKEQFTNALQDNAPLFVASLIDIYSGNKSLQACDPGAVIMEALKAATLRLPINRQLGFAWIVAYKKRKKEGTAWIEESLPQMQMGWKGYVQLALRTAQYRHINAGIVCEGQDVKKDFLTGEIKIVGEPKNETTTGYFAYFELLNGFKKADYWTKEKTHAHGKRYAPSYDQKGSAWQTEPDSMCVKTVLANLLRKYGIMSVEMVAAYSQDVDERTPAAQFTDAVTGDANTETINTETGEVLHLGEPGPAPKPEPQGPDF